MTETKSFALFSKKFNTAVIFALILLGAAARLIDLNSHFTHVDDIGVARAIILRSKGTEGSSYEFENREGVLGRLIKLFEKVTIIPKKFTYAPLQFIFSYFLLWPGQSYREILFWGRLPSCLFGILGLLAIVCFYKKYDRLKTPAVFVALCLTAFSYENVIYAKQMESYSIGVWAAACVLILWVRQIKTADSSFKALFPAFAGMAVLSHAQYQILFFMPAFAVSLFAYHLLRFRNRWFETARNFLAAGITYGILIFPMYWLFLRHKEADTPGLTWNVGPAREFQFPLLHGESLLTQVGTGIVFFAKNFPVVFGGTLAFMPESHPLFTPATWLLMVFFALGIAGLCASKTLRKKTLALFFLLTALTWAALVITQKLAFSPTRHSLILLPFFAVLTAEGWNFLARLLKRLSWGGSWRRFAHIPLIGFILVMFWMNFHSFLAERKDPFDETQIESKLSEFDVDTVMTTGWTWNLSFMKSVREQFNCFDDQVVAPPTYRERPIPHKTIAFISHRNKLNPALFEDMKLKINLYLLAAGRTDDLLTAQAADYRLIYYREIDSDTEVDFSSKTKNGTNGFYFYILRKNQPFF